MLGLDPEDVEDFLLVIQQGERFSVEGMALGTKVSADHTHPEQQTADFPFPGRPNPRSGKSDGAEDGGCQAMAFAAIPWV